jgi:hypothetical protein
VLGYTKEKVPFSKLLMVLATFFTRSTRNELDLDLATWDRLISRYTMNEGVIKRIADCKNPHECDTCEVKVLGPIMQCSEYR